MKVMTLVIAIGTLVFSQTALSWGLSDLNPIGRDGWVNKGVEKTKKEAERVEKRVEKEINRTDENLHKHIKKTGKAMEKGARDTRDFVDENKETIAVVAAVAAVGWVACADGCTLVGSLLIAGASGTTAAIASAETTINDDGTSGSQPKSEKDAKDEEEEQKLKET